MESCLVLWYGWDGLFLLYVGFLAAGRLPFGAGRLFCIDDLLFGAGLLDGLLGACPLLPPMTSSSPRSAAWL